MIDPSGFVYLSLANNPTAMMVMRELQARMDSEAIDWQAAPTLHITLAYAPSVGDGALIEISQEIHAPQPLRVDFLELGIFENGDERALHIKVAPSDVLRLLQKQIHDAFYSRDIELSSYSNPDRWEAHITLAYLPPGINAPNVDIGNWAISDKVIVGRGDYEPFAEITATHIGDVNKAWIVKQADSPLRLMFIVTSNAYRDREQEIVSEKALSDYVESCWNGEVFIGDNVHLLWHDGDPIGDIVGTEMQGPFLIEVSRERSNTVINVARQGEQPLYTTIKAVWDALETAPDLAASHRFFYDEQDRKDLIYDMIVKTETSTLPRWAAANVVTLSEVVKDGR